MVITTARKKVSSHKKTPIPHSKPSQIATRTTPATVLSPPTDEESQSDVIQVDKTQDTQETATQDSDSKNIEEDEEAELSM